jgi:hypothetical protein
VGKAVREYSYAAFGRMSVCVHFEVSNQKAARDIDRATVFFKAEPWCAFAFRSHLVECGFLFLRLHKKLHTTRFTPHPDLKIRTHQVRFAKALFYRGPSDLSPLVFSVTTNPA